MTDPSILAEAEDLMSKRHWPVWRRVLAEAADAVLNAAVRYSARRSDRRLAAGKGRTVWGVTPILSLPIKARCDELLGFRSESLVWMTYRISSNFDWHLKVPAKLIHLFPWADYSLSRLVLAWAIIRYDVFHLFFDRGILPAEERFGIQGEELSALHRAGKRVYIFAYGADVRTHAKTMALGEWNFCRDCDQRGKYCICDDTVGNASLARATAGATAVVALGDMLTYLPGAHHLDYWPIDCTRVVAAQPRDTGEPLRVAHAPNHTHFKGTAYFEQALERLRLRGKVIEWVKISGVPNDQVHALFATVDIVFDQLIGGAYGYTALEGMAHGKPVITYVRQESLVEAPDECPLINATPDTIEDVLEWCIDNRDALAAIGAQGRAYVERRHSIEAVAARFAGLYLSTGNFPDAVAARLQDVLRNEPARLQAIPQPGGWDHPWRIPAARRVTWADAAPPAASPEAGAV